ncbi:hypothetical protein F5888DRAFT_1808461 [Russula emetica]|nr:hypothetical protein F5888DRAFT_1808461 [Russula emetica]
MPEEESTAEKEVSWHIRDHWLFDADDEPSVGPDGPDEKDRVLGDEFHPKYLLKGMSLYQEDDHQRLTTDPTIYTPSSDGRPFGFLPYRTGIAPAFCRDAIITSPAPPSLNGSEELHSLSTPAPQRDSATPSAEATPAGMTAASPMPIKPTQPHAAISIPNGYHIQNNYAMNRRSADSPSQRSVASL